MVGELVALADGQFREAFRVNRFDRAAGVQRAAKHLEGTRAENIRQVRQRHGKTAIRLVAAKFVHRLRVGHARKRRRDLDAVGRAENRRQHAFRQRQDIVRHHERRFDVDLGEFRLAIGAQIFVAKTLGDLKISFDPAHHQQLLVLLRRLRKRVEFSFRLAARNKKIAGAFRRALGKDRRLDFDEPLFVEVIARRFRDAMPHPEIARHLRPAQIEVAVAQAQIFIRRFRIDRERQNIGSIQDLAICLGPTRCRRSAASGSPSPGRAPTLSLLPESHPHGGDDELPARARHFLPAGKPPGSILRDHADR